MTATQPGLPVRPQIIETSIGGIIRYNADPSGSVMAKLSAITQIWSLRSKTRHQLRQLDDRSLMDIGVARVDAMIETRKYFWQR